MIKQDMLINLVDRVVVAATPTKRTTIATPTSISRAIKAIGKVRKELTAISNTKGMTKFRKETVNGWKIRFSILSMAEISTNNGILDNTLRINIMNNLWTAIDSIRRDKQQTSNIIVSNITKRPTIDLRCPLEDPTRGAPRDVAESAEATVVNTARTSISQDRTISQVQIRKATREASKTIWKAPSSFSQAETPSKHQKVNTKKKSHHSSRKEEATRSTCRSENIIQQSTTTCQPTTTPPRTTMGRRTLTQ